MSKGRIQVTIDQDLYDAFQRLPRKVSVSGAINILLKLAIEEVKMGREMSDKELVKWMEKDPYRAKIRKYLQEKLGPHIDVLKDIKTRIKSMK